MTSMSGSELARLVLGYLKSQQMDQLALDFAKESPYLREEYRCLKHGIKMKTIIRQRSLFDIMKEYIDVDDIVTEFYENELIRYESIPYELKELKTMKDIVQYVFQKFKLARENLPGPSTVPTVSRKRPNTTIISNSSDSDSTDRSSSHITNEHDSSNNVRPPRKRRRLAQYIPDVMMTEKYKMTNENSKIETSIKLSDSTQHQDPTSSKYFQVSPSKYYHLDESLQDAELGQLIAQGINETMNKSNIQMEGASEKVGNMIQQPTMQDLLHTLVTTCGVVCEDGVDLQSSHSSLRSENDNEPAHIEENRELNTPIPNESTSNGGRYNLRSNRKSSSKFNKKERPQILSNERVNILPKGALECRSETIELSDSDCEAVTTTSQRQQIQYHQLQQQQSVFYDVSSGMWYILRSEDGQSQPQLQVATSSVDHSLDTIANPATSNVIDQSQVTVIDGSNLLSIMASNQSCSTISDDERKRLIVVNSTEVNKEGTETVQTIEIDQQPSIVDTIEIVTEQSHVQADKDKMDAVVQLKQISNQKVVTPKQLIKSNIPSSSRSLSTPRNKNPHVRVLDFNCTPNRFRLSGISENKNESISNISRFFAETPHNRSIASSMPSSAPPKVDSTVQSHRISIEKAIESSSTDVFIPSDENTVISVDGETPKVRKTNRKSCVRSISTEKETYSDMNKKRLKRVAATKKKICPDDDDDSKESEASNKKADPKISNDDAMAEWQKARNASKNPELFEQQLREQNSKKQEGEFSIGRKKKPTRSKKKKMERKKQMDKTLTNDSTKAQDISLNSSIDTDVLNSTQTNLEARLLEENLKSAKIVTPVKPLAHKTARKKTPAGKLQIKLMPSPKNKALKRLRNSKNLVKKDEVNKSVNLVGIVALDKSSSKEDTAEPEAKAESRGVVNSEMKPELNNLIGVVASDKPFDIRNTEKLVAQNLIEMEKVILQQENERKKSKSNEIQSDSGSMSQPPVNVATTASESISKDKLTTALWKSSNQSNLSMSSLLETPFKDGDPMFPQTPNFLQQLTTPMPRMPCESLMDLSLFKNPQFPTPNFPITPGSFFKDILSPQSEEIVYGAPNRPTDYSSSSSYYKPDESDGIDRQIQANIQSAHKNSSVHSVDDDMEESAKIDETTQNTSRGSSSSSSSSSDSSDSDSDSDSSSTSDSDTSQKAEENFAPDQNEDEQQTEQSTPVDNVIDEDTTQEIKSHLVSASHVKIAQNILLSEPEAPILNEDEEQSKLLNEKLRRMQETLRKDEMKNHEKLKPKQTKKYHRTVNETKRDRLRAVPTTSPLSKRKSTQPKKIVSIQLQQIYSEAVTITGSHTEQLIDTNVQTQSIITERLKTEAAGDNAIADACDASLKIQKTQNSSIEDEESVEAIKTHIDKSESVVSEEMSAPKKNAADGPSQVSHKSLIDILSEKQKKFDANRPKTKTEVIEALPLTRTTRSRTRNQRNVIVPAKNIIVQHTLTTSGNAKTASKTTDSTKSQRRPKDNKSNIDQVAPNSTIPNQKERSELKQVELPKVEMVNKKPELSLVTPAKKRLMREMFGDCSDIETPIKSPPKSILQPNRADESSNVVKNSMDSQANKPPAPEIENHCNKFEADSSNVNEISDESDESDSDEDEYEMIFSIDESDKKRFICIREDASVKSKAVAKSMVIGTKKVFLPDNVRISLEPSDVMELYTQDVSGVTETKKDKDQTRSGSRSGKETRTETTTEIYQFDSESTYGKPIHTSTPSPTKAVTPKFNIKHKSTDLVSPKSAKKNNVTKQNDFNGIQIDDILYQLHPTPE